MANYKRRLSRGVVDVVAGSRVKPEVPRAGRFCEPPRYLAAASELPPRFSSIVFILWKAANHMESYLCISISAWSRAIFLS
jgi:hypothetical protein